MDSALKRLAASILGLDLGIVLGSLVLFALPLLLGVIGVLALVLSSTFAISVLDLAGDREYETNHG